MTDPAPEPRREVKKTDASIDAECLRTADHDDEVDAFRREVRKLMERYWFIGRAELLGAMEVEKFLALTRWVDAPERDDDGDEWKHGGVPAP